MAEDLQKIRSLETDTMKATDFTAEQKAAQNFFFQGDVKTAILTIDIKEDGRPLNLDNRTVRVSFEKPDGTNVIQDQSTGVTITDVANGRIKVELRTQVLAAVGKVRGQVAITEANDTITESSEFSFTVKESLANGAILSSDDLPLLQQVIIAANILNGVDLQQIVDLNETVQGHTEQITALQTNVLNGEFVETKGFEYNGFNFTSIVAGDFQNQRSKDLLDYGKSAAAMDSVAIVCTWFMETATSNTISRDPIKTVPDADVIQAIRDAKAKGYKVMLKPHIDSHDGVWRGSITPLDLDAWFASYNTFIMTYANIAQAEGVDIFCIGTELKSSTGSDSKKAKWLPIIANIKAVYTGALTYAATAMNSDDYEEYLLLGFWDQFDYMGLDIYFKLVDSSNTAPSVYEIASAWSMNTEGRDLLKKIIDWQKMHNKPVLFTECGATNLQGTAHNPIAFPSGATIDLQEQADYIKAELMVWSSQTEWLKGFFWWRLAFNPNDAFTFENRPAADIFKKWITHTKGV